MSVSVTRRALRHTLALPCPPVLPAAAKQPTQAGAEAFYRYFWDTYTYAFLTLDEAAQAQHL